MNITLTPIFFITEWASVLDYENFIKENQAKEKQCLRHINQFELDSRISNT